MQPAEALSVLGSNRVIWIDDQFTRRDDPSSLAKLLAINMDSAIQSDIPKLSEYLSRLDDGDPNAESDLIELLTSMSPEQRSDIKRQFDAPDMQGHGGTIDLSDGQVDAVCRQLNIDPNDRWTFDEAHARMSTVHAEGDEHVSYIIDLKNSYHGPEDKQGLDLLQHLRTLNSNATAFLLTHEVDAKSEARTERELRASMDEQYRNIPFCVVAKERFEGEPIENFVAEGLRVAIKRAGLRRSVHEVLLKAKSQLEQAFDEAMTSLLHITPEQLEDHVVQRAYAEGVSELHVVERALTASISESIRTLFATDLGALKSARRLRSLRNVPLTAIPSSIDDKHELESFRRKELWESRELLNASFSPLACGDVFEFDADEGCDDPDRMFILLVQPCDVTLRPKGNRDSDTGFLIPLKLRNNDQAKGGNLKLAPLPFLLDGKQWYCDFRKATSAQLSLLDLATVRSDGKVCCEENQNIPDDLLPGQLVNARDVCKKLQSALATRREHAKRQPPKFFVDSRCQLTLSSSGPFQQIAHATYSPAKSEADGTCVQQERLTWKIRRSGRVRMPYAAALLSSYLAVIDRAAFDLDYLRPLDMDESCVIDCKAN